MYPFFSVYFGWKIIKVIDTQKTKLDVTALKYNKNAEKCKYIGGMVKN